MKPVGLVISGQSRTSDSAYAYRVEMLAKCLQERSIHCDLFFLPDHKPLDTETTASLFMPLWFPMLRKYDFLYCGAPMAGQALYWCRRFLRGQVLLDMHGDDIAQSQQANEFLSGGTNTSASLRVRLIYHMALSTADYWLTQSAYQRQDLVASGLPDDRVKVVRNGVDLDLFRFMPQPEEPAFTFGYVGAFQVWQGINEVVEAFSTLEDPAIRILFVGFKAGDHALKDELRNRFGTRVELVDMVDRTTIVELLRSVAVLVSARPSHVASRAAFPTKFAEYASVGRPIVVTGVDETADFVRKYKCGFVAEANSQSLAQTLLEAARMPRDTLAAMGRNARMMAEENFSWKKIGDEYAQLITEITSYQRPCAIKGVS